MNRTKKFLKNTFATALYQVVLMLSGFILPKIILTFYGSEINGLVISITQFVNYFTLVEAGLAGAAVYALYKPLADNAHKTISGIVVATKKFYNISGALFLIFVIALALIFPLFVTAENLSYMDMLILILIIGVNGTMDFFVLGKYRAILTADQKQYLISLGSLGYCVLNTAIIAIFAWLGFNIVIARLAAVGAIIFRSAILALYCKKHYNYLDFKQPPITKALNKRWDALILQILGVVHTGSPVVLATIFTSLKEVSVYAIFNMVMNGINSVLGIFTTGLGSGFGDLIARKEKKALQNAYEEFELIYYMLIAFVYSVTMVQIMSFVELYTRGMTDINYNRPFLGMLFVINGYLYNLKTPQGMLVISAGLYKETKKQTLTQAALAVSVGAILGAKYGIAGILIGSCVSNLYRDIDLIMFIPKHVTGLPIVNSLKNICVSLVGTIVIWLVGSGMSLRTNTIVDWIINSVIVSCFAILSLLVLLLIFRRKQFARCKNRILNVLKR